ncbi:purine-nucleoside phosphorylase [Arenimonas caeni]|jgi:purine-nucleoside phosphorylase|uniref:purine-nucleoside phosphorylase n=1 Tax=Arenimonas caeni TaxID=2058085 RepID=UPI002A36490A|nr:purine-nucleoside phosphorylase [Arenimonas caeni]MDY0022461.1 purine-nucleoside phosphorylase [Arenimonas caeni]
MSLHINAAPGDFAPTVLLPGDPMRARHIAQAYLADAREITSTRGMFGYTGLWQGQRLSVMGSGMGIPSCVLYATELVREHGVRRLLRVGTCGAVSPRVTLGDLVLAVGAGTDSGVNRQRFGGHDFPATASWPLLRALAGTAESAGTPLHVGNIFSTDLFHHPDPALVARLSGMGILGIEMEAAGLFGAAAALGVEAGALLAVSDHLLDGGAITPEERERGLDRMIRLALDGAAAMPAP